MSIDVHPGWYTVHYWIGTTLEHRKFDSYEDADAFDKLMNKTESKSNYAVVGRLHGDDEDHCICYQDCTEAQARENFISDTRDLEDISQDDIDEGYEHTNVYITMVLRSDTPMEVVTYVW